MSLKIRRATLRDTDRIIDLCQRVIHASIQSEYSPVEVETAANAYSASRVSDWIENGDVLCGIKTRKMVACAILRGPIIMGLFVERDLQRRGYGRLLLSQILEIAKAKGLPRIVVASALPARPFYEKNGFKFIIRAYSRNLRTDLMYKHLASGNDNDIPPRLRLHIRFAFGRLRYAAARWFKKNFAKVPQKWFLSLAYFLMFA